MALVRPADDPAIRRRLLITVALLLGTALLHALVALLFARADGRGTRQLSPKRRASLTLEIMELSTTAER